MDKLLHNMVRLWFTKVGGSLHVIGIIGGIKACLFDGWGAR
jgi:hypothetical protein